MNYVLAIIDFFAILMIIDFLVTDDDVRSLFIRKPSYVKGGDPVEGIIAIPPLLYVIYLAFYHLCHLFY